MACYQIEPKVEVRWIAQWMAVYLCHFGIDGVKMPSSSCTYPVSRLQRFGCSFGGLKISENWLSGKIGSFLPP